MSVLENFKDWKEFLGNRVDAAMEKGMDNEVIHNVAYQIGGYLSSQVDPKNEQERLLKELWDAGDEEQQRALASLLVKLVQERH